jgi:Pentapeptide repeats (8 copies)
MGPIPKVLSLVLLVGCLDSAVAIAGEVACDGPYKGRKLTPEELATVLRNHWAWLESYRKPDDERKANLCQADLRDANLQEADLVYANLQEAVYEPKPGMLPNFWTLTALENRFCQNSRHPGI